MQMHWHVESPPWSHMSHERTVWYEGSQLIAPLMAVCGCLQTDLAQTRTEGRPTCGQAYFKSDALMIPTDGTAHGNVRTAVLVDIDDLAVKTVHDRRLKIRTRAR